MVVKCLYFFEQTKEEIFHKLLRSSQKLIHVGHPEGEQLHDKVMALKLEFKQFKKRVNERKENLKKHLSFCEQGKEVAVTKLTFCKKTATNLLKIGCNKRHGKRLVAV